MGREEGPFERTLSHSPGCSQSVSALRSPRPAACEECARGLALLIILKANIHLGAGVLPFSSNNGLKHPDINGPDNLRFA